MPSQKCLDNIAKAKPPYNKPCTDAYCQSMSFEIGYVCSQQGLPPSSAISFKEPGVGDCSCCCPDAGAGLAVAIDRERFTLSADLKGGDVVLVAGPDLKWRSGRVEHAGSGKGGHAPAERMHTDIFVVYVMLIDDLPPLRASNLVVALDHLFLMAAGKLKPAATLREGDQIRRADGGLSRVSMVSTALGSSPTPVVAVGSFDDRSLDGHLVNTAGVVSADYAVQVAFATGGLPSELLA
jgi:hypothetical protein